MVKIAKSFEARHRNYLLKHWQKTKWGKNIRALKDSHAGERCFIVGNGPSLKMEDLEKLKNEYTFAFNRIYLSFDQVTWRPTFYCTQDIKLAKNSRGEILENISTEYVFAPIDLFWYEGIDLKTDYYFSPVRTGENKPGFSIDADQRIYTANTVAYTAIQLAVYMGFTDIYLIGVDHNFHTYQDKNGNIVHDDHVKDYFTEKYNSDQSELFVPRLDVSSLSYESAQEYAENNSVHIYNATRGGKLEIFPRVDFDSLEF